MNWNRISAVRRLFSENLPKKMEATAQTAFSNMGLSVSDFLATANKMGSLFKGAGFDVEEAADLTAEAMQRAADVASIMGIDVSVAMESVAGAAKGNFTMMDNLGVAINDTNLQAYALANGIKKSTSEMTTQEKIALAMQMFLEKTADYAGNYAKENETLAGSLTTAKAALSNFMSGASDVSQVADALVNAGTVISEKLLGLLPSLVSGIGALLDALIPEVPPLLQELLPAVVDGAVTLVNGLVASAGALISALMGIVPDLIAAAGEIMSTIGSALVDNIDFILDSALQIVLMLAEGLLSALPKLADAACEIVEKLGDWIAENADTLVEAAVNLIATLTRTLVTEIPKLVKKAAQAVAKALPALVKSFGSLYNQMGALEKVVLAVVAGFVAFKAVTAIVAVIKAVKTAFLALNAAMAANPFAAIIVGITALTGLFVALAEPVSDAGKSYYHFSEAQQEIIDRAEKAREELEELNEAFEESAEDINTEASRTEELWRELQNLTDETGYVTDANKERAGYILGELNEALGTEYELNGNIISQYQQMQDEVANLIKQKQAEALLAAAEDTYTANVQLLNSQEQELYVKQQAIDDIEEAMKEGWQSIYDYVENRTTARYNGDLTIPEEFERRMAEHGYAAGTFSYDDEGAYNTAAAIFAEMFNVSNTDIANNNIALDKVGTWFEPLSQARDAYDQSRDYVNSVRQDVAAYEDAQQAFYTGDYSSAISLLTDDITAMWHNLEQGSPSSDADKQKMQDDLDFQQFQIQYYKDQLDAGTYGYTQAEYDAMVDTFNRCLELFEKTFGEATDAVENVALKTSGSVPDKGGEYTIDKFLRPYEYDQANTTQHSADDVVITQTSLSDEDRADVQNISDKIDEVINTLAAAIQGGFMLRLNEREFGRLVLRTVAP